MAYLMMLKGSESNITSELLGMRSPGSAVALAQTMYVDDDDDDIIESNFSQLLKEEKHSAKEGYREDLEEERKLREMEKRKKLKKMKK
ncbi:UNVERIFIED_CONTAM: hypothetical protein NCL1_28054 [Trichonephila clavipes]